MGFAEITRQPNAELGSLLRRRGRIAARPIGSRPQGSGLIAAAPVSASVLDSVGSPVIVASHRRSGTHLTIDLLRRQFSECDAWKLPGEGLDSLYTNLDRLGWHREPLSEARLNSLLGRARRPLVKTHLPPEMLELRSVQGAWVDQLRERAKVIYVVRDGRAVMVSAQRHEARLGCDVGRDLIDYMHLSENGQTRARAWASHVERWMSEEGVLVVRYEDIIGRGAKTLERIGDFLGLVPRGREPIQPALVRGRWRKRAMRLTRLHPPTTALTPPTAPRPWHEFFGPEELAFFDAEAGSVMRKLGYVEEASGTLWDELAPIL